MQAQRKGRPEELDTAHGKKRMQHESRSAMSLEGQNR
jgi:hypothetical protein